LIRPYDLTQSSLYPTRKPGAKPPLLGPSKKVAIQVDPFYQSGTSPIEHTLNPNFTLAFVNSLGRIKGRAETGLTRRSQRRVGKMVRRARAMGLVSKFSDRPAVGGFGSTSSRRGR
jgi:small subunit ribosomal protein S18